MMKQLEKDQLHLVSGGIADESGDLGLDGSGLSPDIGFTLKLPPLRPRGFKGVNQI